LIPRGGAPQAHPASFSPGWPDLWEAVDALIDRAPRDSDLRIHGIDLLASDRLRRRAVHKPLTLAELRSHAVALTVTATLEGIRAAYDGRLLLMKGPEVAAYYPDPALRAYSDLDLVVADVGTAWRSLLRAGFEPVGDPDIYIGIHHLRPLAAPGLPLVIELHDRPKWITGGTAPSAEALFDSAVPTSLGVEGIEAPTAAQHVLLLAAHSWAHEPLRRLRDLIDIAAVGNTCRRTDIEELAEQWGAERLWRSTAAALDALFGNGPTPWSMRLWGRNVMRAQERTVLEIHAQRWLHGFWSVPPRGALAILCRGVADDLRPSRGEAWRHKWRRSQLALRNAFMRRSEHEEML
jgi:hypothetical protein